MKFSMKKKSKSKEVVPYDSGSPFGKKTKMAFGANKLIPTKKKAKKK